MNRVSYRSDIVGFCLHMMYIYYNCSDPRPAPSQAPRPQPGPIGWPPDRHTPGRGWTGLFNSFPILPWLVFADF